MIGGSSVGNLIANAIRFYEFLIFIYVVLSWFPSPVGALADLRSVLATICEPWVGLFRRMLPVAMVGGTGLDFSPLIALLVLGVIGQFVARL